MREVAPEPMEGAVTKRELLEALAEVEDDAVVLLNILASSKFVEVTDVRGIYVIPSTTKPRLMEFALPSDNGTKGVVIL